jgi:hypothetical protein
VALMDCYRLARFYSQSPEHFLAMTLSQIDRHMVRTIKLIEEMRKQED